MSSAKTDLVYIKMLVREMFEMFDTVEESNGVEFNPTGISSCRVRHTERLNELLPKLKEACK